MAALDRFPIFLRIALLVHIIEITTYYRLYCLISKGFFFFTFLTCAIVFRVKSKPEIRILIIIRENMRISLYPLYYLVSDLTASVQIDNIAFFSGKEDEIGQPMARAKRL